MLPTPWHLFAITARLLPIEGAGAAYDEALSYRVALVEACAAVTEDRSERYLCAWIPRFESAYRADVGRCDVRGAQGELTAWQILPRSAVERARLCISLESDARVAVERIRESRAACRTLPKEEQLALYARGDCASVEGRRLSRHRWPSPWLVGWVERTWRDEP